MATSTFQFKNNEMPRYMKQLRSATLQCADAQVMWWFFIGCRGFSLFVTKATRTRTQNALK